MFFSATLDGEVAELARAYTHNPSRFDGELPGHLERGETEHRFVGVTADNKVETLVEMLGHDDGLTLVFVRTKRGADRLVQRLRRHEIRAVAMHGDMTQGARERAPCAIRWPARSRRSSRPMSPPAGSISRTSAHVINFVPPPTITGYTPPDRANGASRPRRDWHTLVLP